MFIIVTTLSVFGQIESKIFSTINIGGKKVVIEF